MRSNAIAAAALIIGLSPGSPCSADQEIDDAPPMGGIDRTVGSHVLNCIENEGHHIYKDTETCSLGGEEFDVLRLGTHSTFGVSLDWERMSYLRFPVPLPVCPANGFIMDGEELSDEALARRKAVIESPEYQAIYAQRHATYYLYARMLQMLDKNPENWWWFYRQATSEADLCQAPDMYREYAHETISEGKRRMEQLDETSDEYWVLSIVIPNMYRRTSEFAAAQKWLDEFDQARTSDLPENNFGLGHKLLRQAISAERSDRIPLEEGGLESEE